MSNPTVKEIVKNWLKEHGYDGLYSDEYQCCCDLDDLMDCDFFHWDCRVGYKASCNDGECCEMCENWHYHIQPDKPEKTSENSKIPERKEKVIKTKGEDK